MLNKLIWVLFSLEGRISRSYYVGIYIAFQIIGQIIQLLCTAGHLTINSSWAIFALGLLSSWPALAIQVKRFQDFDVDARSYLIFVMICGFGILLYFVLYPDIALIYFASMVAYLGNFLGSGGLLLAFLLLGIAGFLVEGALMFMPGTYGENRFGRRPNVPPDDRPRPPVRGADVNVSEGSRASFGKRLSARP